jgi:hypothetical protein
MFVTEMQLIWKKRYSFMTASVVHFITGHQVQVSRTHRTWWACRVRPRAGEFLLCATSSEYAAQWHGVVMRCKAHSERLLLGRAPLQVEHSENDFTQQDAYVIANTAPPNLDFLQRQQHIRMKHIAQSLPIKAINEARLREVNQCIHFPVCQCRSRERAHIELKLPFGRLRGIEAHALVLVCSLMHACRYICPLMIKMRCSSLHLAMCLAT